MNRAMLKSIFSLDQVNALSRDEFVAAFGDVAEHSPWVAEKAAGARPFTSRRAMAEAFVDAVLAAGEPHKLALLRAHPDLAGRAAVAGEIAEYSKREQAGAGLDRLTPEEFGRFSALNEAYRKKFRFPFILAVKGIDKHGILHSFEERIANDPEAEFANAVRQVAQLVAFRIDDRVSP
jgi:2-oxo-4-hydroxy-4-carboxy-5-ureidoimidazoline decarboxylase